MRHLPCFFLLYANVTLPASLCPRACPNFLLMLCQACCSLLHACCQLPTTSTSRSSYASLQLARTADCFLLYQALHHNLQQSCTQPSPVLHLIANPACAPAYYAPVASHCWIPSISCPIALHDRLLPMLNRLASRRVKASQNFGYKRPSRQWSKRKGKNFCGKERDR